MSVRSKEYKEAQQAFNHQLTEKLEFLSLMAEPIKYTWYNKLYRWLLRKPQQYNNKWADYQTAAMKRRNVGPIKVNRIKDIKE